MCPFSNVLNKGVPDDHTVNTVMQKANVNLSLQSDKVCGCAMLIPQKIPTRHWAIKLDGAILKK